MIEEKTREQIIALMRREVVPAVGCTEPMAVALCVARATEALGTRPEKITALLSANILKNAMGVGIPGTGMIGLPIAIALGALIGKSEYQLEVIKDVCPEAIEQGKQYINEGRINIQLKKDCCDKLYVEVLCEGDGHRSSAIIQGSHTHFVSVTRDDEVLLDEHAGSSEGDDSGDIALNLRLVYDFAMQAPLDEIRFILETRDYNLKAAQESVKGNYGHCLGKTMDRPLSHGIFGNTIFSRILSKTALATDARMGGALIPVMSNSGSGNQGICATNPVAVYAMENENTEEELIRALTLSHLTAIYIKQSLGKLSALCGCVVASTGSACGIVYLQGGTYDQVCYAIKNMAGNITGMVCDGAKVGCAMKVASGVSCAVQSAVLALRDTCIPSTDGIVEDDVEKTIRNVGAIGSAGMKTTDSMILDIMLCK